MKTLEEKITYDQNKLRKKSKQVKEIDLDKIVTELHKYFDSKKAVSLCAQKIGINKSVSLVNLDSKDFFVLYNPKVLELKNPKVVQEMCISIPEKHYKIERFSYIKIKNGDGKEYEFENSNAQIIQHEIDHFNGILVIDRKLQPIKVENKIGRNDLCFCGSGKKYKKCHLQ